MNLVIIPIDGAVYVDGYSFSDLDLSDAPSNVHALQWKNDKGWIEFKDLDDGTKPQNEAITELPEWANLCKDKWDEAKAAYDTVVIPPAGQEANSQPISQGTQTL